MLDVDTNGTALLHIQVFGYTVTYNLKSLYNFKSATVLMMSTSCFWASSLKVLKKAWFV